MIVAAFDPALVREEERQIRDIDLSLSLTLYREGAEFPSLSSVNPSLESEDRLRPDPDMLYFMTSHFGRSALFLDSMKAGPFQWLDLSDPQPYSREDEVLAIFYSDLRWKEPIKVLSGFRLNGEWLDEWTYESVNPQPVGAIGVTDTASVRSLKLDPDQLGEGRLEVIAFERPFQDQSEIDEFQQLIEQSNVLFLE